MTLKIFGNDRWISQQTADAESSSEVQFVDEQRCGPYRLWNHEPRFHQESHETVMTDRVDYGVSGGVPVHRLFVDPTLQQIFAHRAGVLVEPRSDLLRISKQDPEQR